MESRMYFVYILVCLDTGRSYVGHTDDLIRRFHLHCEGSTRTTREKLRRPVMVHWEPCPTRAAAMHRERYFKAGSGHRVKGELIAAGMKVFGTSG
jgi:predicted GIY-YIG superfamily endonuclease